MSHDPDDRAADLLADFELRRRAGEAVDGDALVSAHPELAEELRTGLDAVRRLEHLLPQRPDTPELAPPARIGEYRIVRELGRGGMGVVYEAVQDGMARRVALKVLFPSFTGTARAVERFQREARAAGRLQHTNIVTVYQLGEDRGVWFCAMELVEGRSLDAVLDDLRRMRRAPRRQDTPSATPAPTSGAARSWNATTGSERYFQRIAEMFAEVADALELAHERGVVHRDVKPANLMLSADGRLKLLDFGLARIREEHAGLTVTGGMVGTPSYMSPEQVRSGTIDARSDVYGLGATLYEILTLRPPFDRRDAGEPLRSVLTEEPVPPRRRDAKVPRDLDTIVLKALEKEPAKRYATAADMARDLRAFADGYAVRARRIGPAGRAWRAARRNRLRVAGVALLLFLSGAAAVFLARATDETERRRDLEYEGMLARAGHALIEDLEPYPMGELIAFPANPSTMRGHEIIDRAVEMGPDRPEAYVLRALLLPHRPLSARLADLDTARARGFGDRQYYLLRGILLAPFGDVTDARTGDVRLSPEDAAETALLLGCLQLAAGKRSEAVQALGQAIQRAGPGTWTQRLAFRARGLARDLEGDSTGALDDYLRSTDEAPANAPRLAVRIAAARLRLGQRDAAYQAFRELLETVRRTGDREAMRRVITSCRVSGIPEFDVEALRVAAEVFRGTSEEPHCRAQLLFEEGHPEKALAALDAGKDNPEWSWVLRSSCLLRVGRTREALDVAEAATQREPRDPVAWDHRGQMLLLRGQPEEALRSFLQAASNRPLLGLGWPGAACAASLLGREAEALEYADRAVRCLPNHPMTWINRARVLERSGNRSESLALLRRTVERFPRCAGAWFDLADVLSHTGLDVEAEECSRRAIALEPRRADWWIGLAVVLARTPDRLSDASAAAETSLKLSPSLPLAHATVALVRRRQGRYDDAFDSATRATVLDDCSAAAWGELAQAHALREDFHEAAKAARRALDLMPADSMAWHTLGIALDNAGDLQGALTAARNAVRYGPRREWVTHALLGNVLYRLGEHADAVTVYEEAMARGGEHVELLLHYSGALHGCGRTTEALDQVLRAAERQPQDARIWQWVSTCAFVCRNWHHVLRANRVLVDLEPQASGWRANVALALLETDAGQTEAGREEALRAAERAIELDGANLVAWKIRVKALVSLGRDSQALSALEEAARIPGQSKDVPVFAFDAREDQSLIADLLDVRMRLLAVLGRTEEILPLLETSSKALPNDAEFLRYDATCALWVGGRRDLARELARKSLDADHGAPLPLHRAWFHVILGDEDSARSALQGLPDDVDLHKRAEVHALLGERDDALRDLAEAQRKGSRMWVAKDPSFESLADDPRYEEIRRAMLRPGQR